MNRSIQSRLTVALTAAAMVLSAGAGALFYHVAGAEMTHNFDRGLESKGQAVVSLVSYEAGGVLDFEFNDAAMPEYRPGKRAEYFQIQYLDGRPYAHSKSLDNAPSLVAAPNRDGNGLFYDVKLPNGRNGRAIQIIFAPQTEQEPHLTAAPMVAIVARDRRELDDSRQDLLRSLIAVTLLLCVTTAGASVWIVRRSLRPLRSVAEQAAAIDAAKLDRRLSEHNLPNELIPICEKLNDLLSRLEAAFTRERRFTSDVAHELRTPIAELRSIAEVALKWPEDPHATHEALNESLAIAMQMQTLVNTLLALVRSNQSNAVLQPIPLAECMEQTIAGLQSAAKMKPIELQIPADLAAAVEPTLFRSILINLLTNASDYSVGPDSIRCTAKAVDDQVELSIENQTGELTQADLAHMFDPFWRKETSRSNSAHVGLGLSLVRAYCGLMGMEIHAELDESKTLRMILTCAAAKLPMDVFQKNPTICSNQQTLRKGTIAGTAGS